MVDVKITLTWLTSKYTLTFSKEMNLSKTSSLKCSVDQTCLDTLYTMLGSRLLYNSVISFSLVPYFFQSASIMLSRLLAKMHHIKVLCLLHAGACLQVHCSKSISDCIKVHKLLDKQQEKDSQHYLWDKLTERQLPTKDPPIGFLIVRTLPRIF